MALTKATVEQETGFVTPIAVRTIFDDPDGRTYLYVGVGLATFRIPLQALLPP